MKRKADAEHADALSRKGASGSATLTNGHANSKKPTKRVQLCFLETACTGGYMAAGQWKRPGETSSQKDTLKYYLDLARLAERGKIAAVFLADWYVGFDVYDGSLDACLNRGHQVAHLDPLPIVSGMAAVTENVAFAVTMTTTYVNPYMLARQMSTIDHLTGGRCAWNIVTSFTEGAALAFGQDSIIGHDERYAMADEYMDVVYKLWESSWAPDSVVWDRKKGLAFDAEKIKRIEHKGKYFNMTARSQVHPSPQRTPVLFQAGTSKAGSQFATKHAEAIFLNPISVELAKEVIARMRKAAGENGRDPKSILFFPCIIPYIGRTEEDAKAKACYAAAEANADPIAGLAQFSGYTGIDMSAYELDEVIKFDESKSSNAIQSVFRSFESGGTAWTPRTLGMRMALGGLHPIVVGSAEQVADEFERWITEADCDGFNIASVTNPTSWEDVVDLLRPELLRRGLVWDDYDVPGGTFRENLLGSKYLRDDHYGASFRWGTERAKAAAEVQKPKGKAEKSATGISG
ncbi:Nitrilotriacetate monooxygenase component A/pristinamycin IIA synthase subunit A [Thozetella sp. PMI_491]|nr:Nitrilotriacetate monooxygenase component A/pristinamycin IIA synthase subunit A [Thozetella sp. PMI_491]